MPLWIKGTLCGILELELELQRNNLNDLHTMRPGSHFYMFFSAQESRLLFSLESPSFFVM